MSFTVIVPPTAKADLTAAIRSSTPTIEDVDDRAAVDAMLAVVAEHVDELAAGVGRPDDQVIVEIAGHANADHAPVEGRSDEVLHLTVRAVPSVT